VARFGEAPEGVSETEALKQKLVAILAADVAGYSRLMGADERATVATLDAARGVFRNQIEANHGRVVDMAGDSVLAVFETAAGATTAALGIQQELETTFGDVAEDRRLRFRIGVHLGDVIEKADATVYGDGVNIAARLQALAEPGGVTVSEPIRATVKGKISASFEDRGEQAVKNIAEPIRTYRMTLTGGGAVKPSQGIGEPDLSLPDKPSIAVLPFSSMSSDPEQGYFADGVVEDIITELSRFRSLFVIARNSSFSYKGKSPDVRQVGKELGVRYVLEGSIRRAANRLRVSCRLIDSLTGNHIWAEKYDRVLEDVFDVQEEVTRAIVTAIAPQIDAAERAKARRRPQNLSAYEIAVRAWADATAAYQTSDKSLRAQALLEARRALEIDPDSVMALNTVAYVHWQHVFFRSEVDPTASLKVGIDATDRAMELDNSDSTAYWIKGLLIGFPFQTVGGSISDERAYQALGYIRQAHELNSNDAYALIVLGYYEAISGDPIQGIDYLNQALRNNPRDPWRSRVMSLVSLAHFLAKDYEHAVEWGLRALREAPNLLNPQTILAMSYVGLGDIGKAKIALEAARRISPEYVQVRLDGYSLWRKPEDKQRQQVFMRIAAGFEDPSAADAWR
jgi:adenylate cyclase